jgi:hypothetical protein
MSARKSIEMRTEYISSTRSELSRHNNLLGGANYLIWMYVLRVSVKDVVN